MIEKPTTMATKMRKDKANAPFASLSDNNIYHNSSHLLIWIKFMEQHIAQFFSLNNVD